MYWVYIIFEPAQVASIYAAVKYLKSHSRFFEEIPLGNNLREEKISVLLNFELLKTNNKKESSKIQDKKETSIASLNDPLDFFKCAGNEQLLYKE